MLQVHGVFIYYSTTTHHRSCFHNTSVNIFKKPGEKKEKIRTPNEKNYQRTRADNSQKKKFKFKERMLSPIGKQNIAK